jgi:hypothetical protein
MAIADNERFGQSHRQTHSESQMINSETMENKDPAINQHQDDTVNNVNHDYSDQDQEDEKSSEQDDNDTEDPYFQKNAEIAQDLDDDLENKNTSESNNYDSEDSDPDFDQKDTSDLQSDT